jgi:hypothetical protein
MRASIPASPGAPVKNPFIKGAGVAADRRTAYREHRIGAGVFPVMRITFGCLWSNFVGARRKRRSPVPVSITRASL